MRKIKIFVLLWCTLSAWDILANPFSRGAPGNTQSVSRSKLIYHGYAQILNEHFAIIELDGEQYTLKVGDHIKQIFVTQISSKYLKYEDAGKIYAVPIQDAENRENH